MEGIDKRKERFLELPDGTGEIFRQMRKAAGYTQTELGEKLGYSQARVSEYESGKHSPGFETIQRWADACNCRVEIKWEKIKL